MTEQGITKIAMAKRMKTSRAQLDRLLDPENDKVQLDTVQRAAAAARDLSAAIMRRASLIWNSVSFGGRPTRILRRFAAAYRP